MNRDTGSFATNRRASNRMTAVAVRLNSRTATTTQRHGRAPSGNRITFGINDLHVAAHHQRSRRGDGDTGRVVAIDVMRTGIRGGHSPIVRDGGS